MEECREKARKKVCEKVSEQRLSIYLMWSQFPTTQDQASVVMGEISPHQDDRCYESYPSTSTPSSYSKLNYNETIQRYSPLAPGNLCALPPHFLTCLPPFPPPPPPPPASWLLIVCLRPYDGDLWPFPSTATTQRSRKGQSAVTRWWWGAQQGAREGGAHSPRPHLPSVWCRLMCEPLTLLGAEGARECDLLLWVPFQLWPPQLLWDHS